MSRTTIYIASIILGLAGIFFLAWWVVPRVMVTLTKAAPAKQMSGANSYLIAEKILARADGVDKVRVNVFILDADGKGVPGRGVELAAVPASGQAGEAKVAPLGELTDKDGKMSFEITSTEEKQYTVTAEVERVSLGRNLVVTFRD